LPAKDHTGLRWSKLVLYAMASVSNPVFSCLHPGDQLRVRPMERNTGGSVSRGNAGVQRQALFQRMAAKAAV
jgi:hypothetical protein